MRAVSHPSHSSYYCQLVLFCSAGGLTTPLNFSKVVELFFGKFARCLMSPSPVKEKGWDARKTGTSGPSYRKKKPLKKVWFFEKREMTVHFSDKMAYTLFFRSSSEVGKLPQNTLSKSVQNFVLGVTKFSTLFWNHQTVWYLCVCFPLHHATDTAAAHALPQRSRRRRWCRRRLRRRRGRRRKLRRWSRG